MNQKLAVITLDLEPDHAGQIPDIYEGWRNKYIRRLFLLLRSYNVPLSIFIVGKSITNHSSIINYIRKQKSEFYLHSYSHDAKNPDSIFEISKGIAAFRHFFKTAPVGYRAPEGRISQKGLKRLKQYGIQFDSSVFPSFWPHPRYLLFPKLPYVLPHGTYEIPITVIGPLRIIYSLSWIKLIGWIIYRRYIDLFHLPDIVVFNFHMHDLFSLPTHVQLSPCWKFIYSRNKESGVELFNNVLCHLKEHGYTFVPMSTIYRAK